MKALLDGLGSATDPNLIVGFDTSDDAGVYRLSDELALVVTADFITPPTDDPVLFGQIAAANALSDVFAMGGRPVTCVNLVCFPSKKLPPSTLAGIIEGAHSKITEAGAVLAGGHTVDDPEPKFGLAVTGVVHPDRCWTNAGARSGDALILTKPIGSGVLLNANLKGWVNGQDLAACLESLATLNMQAAEVAAAFDVHAATDITGFGLAGHALEMASAARVRFQIDFDRLPVFGGAVDMYQRGMTTGSNKTNRQLARDHMTFEGSFSDAEQSLLFDPQTNGGLLFSVASADAERLVGDLHAAGVTDATAVGHVSDQQDNGPALQVRR